MPFIAVAGSAIGPSHLRKDRPCEDSFATYRSRDGWTSAAVCDGCGSAEHAFEGAQFISSYVASRLLEVGPGIASRGLGEWTLSPVVAILGELRDEMRSRFGRNIGDYAATIVAALISDDAGLVVHIGDGIATAFILTQTNKGTELSPSVQSLPENGEYVNETFYITDPVWLPHLRITPLRRCDFLLICSDGSQPLFFDGSVPLHAKIVRLLRDLHRSGKAASERLEEMLKGPEATKRSDDDKTALLLIAEGSWHRLADLSDRAPPQASRQLTPQRTTAFRLASPDIAAELSILTQHVAELEAELEQTRRQSAIVRRKVFRQCLGAIIILLLIVAMVGYNWPGSIWPFGEEQTSRPPAVAPATTEQAPPAPAHQPPPTSAQPSPTSPPRPSPDCGTNAELPCPSPDI